MNKPFILITNDDGITAPGIQALWRALRNYDVAIAAPIHEKSGSGLAITSTRPLQIRDFPWNDKKTPAWSINGTPADCIKLALSVILEKKPDLIVSGINKGSNSGRNVLYSGTVGGVIEGVIRNIPGIAFSSENFENPKFEIYEKYIPSIIEYFYKNPLSAGTFLNVSFPSDYDKEIQGFKMARQGKGVWTENPEKRFHPAEGHPYYWLGGKCIDFPEEEDSDVALLKQGYITATPLHVNELTDFDLLKNHKILFEDLFGNISDEQSDNTIMK